MNVFESPFITGTIAVLVSGALASHAMKVPKQLFYWFRRRLLMTVEICSDDPAFPWIKEWVSKRVKAKWFQANAVFDGDRFGPRGNAAPKLILFPLGIGFFKFKGKRFLVYIERETVQGSIARRENIIFQGIFAKADIFKEILHEAHRESRGLDDDHVELWIPDGTCWQLGGVIRGRCADSLFLPDGVIERIVSAGEQFFGSEEWYHKMNIPHRLGMLFEGTPGSGKSTSIHVLATKLKCNLYSLSLSSVNHDRDLIHLMSRIPPHSIVQIEDIDAAFKQRDKSDSGITFSGILNALDGTGAKEGRIVVMTTNHKENLDPALIRAGRIDLHVHYDKADSDQARRMYYRFNPNASVNEADRFVERVGGMSMADIQCEILEERKKVPYQEKW